MAEFPPPQIPAEYMDPQTGLLNKTAWHELVCDAVQYSNESSRDAPLSVVFIDINSFKAVNDTFGHAVGDRVIEEVGGLLKVHQPYDMVSRELPSENQEAEGGHFGGDEFAVLARADAEQATRLVTSLRYMFESYLERPENVPLRDHGMGFAIGYAYHERGKPASVMLSAADRAMYEDKWSQLDLDESQQETLRVATEMLLNDGIRLRNVPAYAEKYLRSKKDPRSN